jgi:lipopolysaccharide/colanic/teichoic acid biosynthesis glycosyltransferase
MSSGKRAFDIAGACAGLLVFSPVMALIALGILLDDGGPVLFRQERLGRRRRPFVVLKFRSMRDGKITRAGRVLRATGLDELPQFINVLRNDMSAVGPRPLTSADVLRLGWTSADCDFRWSVPPGLTGLAQLTRTASSEEALALDREYIASWRPLLDCRLIALSFLVNAVGKSRVHNWRHAGKARRLG